MLNLYLVRHAESEMNLKGFEIVMGRENDSPLTEKGIKQAERLGKHLLSEKLLFDRVYSTPAVRGYETAKICCNKINFPLEKIVIAEELQELDEGELIGRKMNEVYTPEIIAKCRGDEDYNWNFKAPNGESRKEVAERVYSLIEIERELLKTTENLQVGFFSHGLAIRCLLKKIMGFPTAFMRNVELSCAGLTELSYGLNGWKVQRINECGYLKIM